MTMKILSNDNSDFSGVVPFYVKDDVIYILLASETWGKNKGLFSPFGGECEKNEDSLSCAVRESFEESGGVYSFDELHLSNATLKIKYHDPSYLNMSFLYFVQVEEIHDNEFFINSANSIIKDISNPKDKWPFQEKEDYEWLNLQQILESLNENEEKSEISNIEGVNKTIHLTDHCSKMLKSYDATLLLSKLSSPNSINQEGMFWGKFDPPTLAHLYIMQSFLTKFPKAKINIIINDFSQSYFYSAEKRLFLLRKILNKEISNHKVNFYIQNENNLYDYSHFKNVNNHVISICGTDSLKLWSQKCKITHNLYDQIVAFQRSQHNYVENEDIKNLHIFKLPDHISNISSTKVRNAIANNLDFSTMVHADIINDMSQN